MSGPWTRSISSGDASLARNVLWERVTSSADYQGGQAAGSRKNDSEFVWLRKEGGDSAREYAKVELAYLSS